MANSTFKKGSGCYVCSICGHKTRVINDSSASHHDSCEFCWDLGGVENEFSDGGITWEECVKEVEQLMRQYKRTACLADNKSFVLINGEFKQI
jgi:hypothetical protein